MVVYAGNDFGDVLRNRLYRLEGGRLVEVAAPGGEPVVAVRGRGEADTLSPAEGPPEAPQRIPARGGFSPVRQTHETYVARSFEMCDDEYQQVVVRGERAVADVFRDHYDADVALQPGSPATEYKQRLLEAVLDRWREAAAAARVPVLVVVVPPAIDACDAFDVKVDRTAYPGYDPGRLSRIAADAARRQGLPVLELYAPFRAEGGNGLDQRHDDDHWNARGQDLAARLAVERLLAEGWLGGASPITASRDAR